MVAQADSVRWYSDGCFRLNQTAEARSELAQSRDIIRSRFAAGLNAGNATWDYWFDWVSARLLLREATALVEDGRLESNAY